MRNRDETLVLYPCNHLYVIGTASKNLIDVAGEIFNLVKSTIISMA